MSAGSLFLEDLEIYALFGSIDGPQLALRNEEQLEDPIAWFVESGDLRKAHERGLDCVRVVPIDHADGVE